jgi:hypothetical protein
MPQNNADAEGNIIILNQQWFEDTGLTFDELVAGGWVKRYTLMIYNPW